MTFNPMGLVLALTFGLTGGLMVALAQPMIARSVKPNRWYGVRTKDTLADARVWYPVNEAGGRDLRRLGLLQVVLGLGAVAVPPSAFDAYVAAAAGLVVVGALALAVRGVCLGRRVRAEVEARDRGYRPG